MQVLHHLPEISDPRLIVGAESADDAAVYKISDDNAIVNTLDYFPPVVDDPFTFGQIAAANSLSDVYAMGAVPTLALNIVLFPETLPVEILNEMLRGGSDKLSEAGTLLGGGHSVEDDGIMYGMSVTGFVNPEKVITNRGARAGDKLILTKPLGVGIIVSAMKGGLRGSRCDEGVALGAVESMKTLNKGASEAMVEVGVNSCTDVTGYGLVGHASEMALGSGVTLVIDSQSLPILGGTIELAGNKKNRPKSIGLTMSYLKENVSYSGRVGDEVKQIIFDPQTSGGLLISVPQDKVDPLMDKLNKLSLPSALIGEVIGKKECISVIVE